MPKLIKTSITQNVPHFDLSMLVKKYIVNQADGEQPPFDCSQFRVPNMGTVINRHHSTMKASLSDWRTLMDRSHTANNTAINNYPTQSHRRRTAPRSQTHANVRSDRKIDLEQSYISRNTNHPHSHIKYNINTNNNECESAKSNRRNHAMTATTRQFQNKSNIKYTPQKTSSSFRESKLDSAIVQNYYQAEYIKDRAIQTAKIRKHYQKPHDNRPISINCQNSPKNNMNINLNWDIKLSMNNNNSRNQPIINSQNNLQVISTPLSKLHKQDEQMAEQQQYKHQNQCQLQQQNKQQQEQQQQKQKQKQYKQYKQQRQKQKTQNTNYKFQLANTMLKQNQNILSRNTNMNINRSKNNRNKRQLYRSGRIVSSFNCDKDGYWMPQKYQKVSLKQKFIRRVNDIIIEGLVVPPQKQQNKHKNHNSNTNISNEGELRFYQTEK